MSITGMGSRGKMHWRSGASTLAKVPCDMISRFPRRAPWLVRVGDCAAESGGSRM